jgi:hypothetical protein
VITVENAEDEAHAKAHETIREEGRNTYVTHLENQFNNLGSSLMRHGY